MTTHRHTENCCNDCGSHRVGTCTGCDRRAHREAIARAKRTIVPFVDVQHEHHGDGVTITASRVIRVF